MSKSILGPPAIAWQDGIITGTRREATRSDANANACCAGAGCADGRLRRLRDCGQGPAARLLRRHLGRRRPAVTARRTSCGVVVTDRKRVLLGHATRSPRWDIPKGEAEAGEDFAAAARELREETGLSVPPPALVALGLYPYLRDKDLALFAWLPAALPDPAALLCTSFFVTAAGERLPEFDRFAILPWEEALARTGRNLARILAAVRRAQGWE